LVVDWEDVPNYSDGLPNDFQIWIELGANEGITYAFGEITTGDMGYLTIGAENRFGNSGGMFYYDGEGTLPGVDDGVQVIAGAPTPGESHTVTFEAKGSKVGPWTNCAYMNSSLFQGTTVSCFTGAVTGMANVPVRSRIRR
jgi:hypothetical protein